MGPNQSPVSYLSASPVQYASKDDPPLMILHAEDDDVVPVGQAKELDELYRKIGLPQKCHIVSHGGHALSNPVFVHESLDFFDEHLDKN
jgi:dipeptidyl aminopeptidase/acylaminoacyl peptidase